MKTKELITEIISLPIEERAIVVDTVLKSMNPTDSETEKKWIATAKKRASELRSGTVNAVPSDKVFSKIWNRSLRMIASFHPEAETVFNFSINYYEDCSEGLGADFALEVYSVIQRILEHPKAWTIMEDGIRRCLTRRFPFSVLYTIEGDELFILAVMNLHRKPDYWNKRM